MEILILTGIFPPDIGGPATYIPQLADSLVAAGESVKVITLSDEPQPDKLAYPVYRVPRKHPKRAAELVAMITKQGLKADLIFANGLFSEVLQANQVLRKPRINKIVADYAWEVASRKGLTKTDMCDFGKQKNLVYNFLRRARNYPAVQAENIIVPSHFLKGIVESWGYQTAPLHVIANGFIAPTDLETAPEIPQPYLVSAGRLIPLKQFDLAIRLIKELPQEYHLAIAGDGPQKKALQQLSRKLKVDQRVHFVGRLSLPQNFYLLQKASLFLLLSVCESFPHGVLEAMGAGIPVLGTNVGGVPEIVSAGEDGVLLPSVEMNTLRETALSLLTDEALRARLIAGGQEKIKKFSWEACFAKTYALIKETVARA